MLYTSWLNEIFKIDYSGPIRNPTAYPYQLSANHLNSGALMTPFFIFTKNINLYFSYIAKYTLIFLTYLNFIYHFLTNILRNDKKIGHIIKIAFGTILLTFLYLFYFAEIEYSLAISNYPLVLLVFTFFAFLVKKDFLKKNEISIALPFFSLCLLIVKAPLFPSLVIALTLYLNSFKLASLKSFFLSINKKNLLLISFSFLLNFLSWIIPTSNHGSLEFTFPLCLVNKSSIETINTCLISVANNPLEGWVITSPKLNFLENIFKYQPIYEFIYIWIICLIPCLISGILLLKFCNSIIYKNYGKFVICYVLASSASIIFLRESIKISGAHTAHLYILSPIFTISSLLIIFSNIDIKQNLNNFLVLLSVPLIAISIIFYNSDYSNTFNKKINLYNGSKSGESGVSLNYKESKKFDQNLCTDDKEIIKTFGLFLNKNGCGNNDLGEIKYGLDGLRTNISIYSKKSIIKAWSLIPK
ncbi:hypothetical protein OA006_00625 [Prochlorococcus sp. AH-736-D21]|nr:hypothetical protein [Prochlorococcus sp. AH-736-D21]